MPSVSISRCAASTSARYPLVMFCVMATSLFLPPFPGWLDGYRNRSRQMMGFPSAQFILPTLPRSRKQLRAPAGKPIDDKAGPLVHGRVRALEPVARDPERTGEIFRPPRAPIDRIGLDRKPGAPARADRAPHMVSRGDQQPALARLRVGNGLAESRILVGVAGTIFGDEPARRNAEIFE